MDISVLSRPELPPSSATVTIADKSIGQCLRPRKRTGIPVQPPITVTFFFRSDRMISVPFFCQYLDAKHVSHTVLKHASRNILQGSLNDVVHPYSQSQSQAAISLLFYIGVKQRTINPIISH